MVLTTLAAADEDGKGGHYGILIVAVLVLVAAAVPVVAAMLGALLLTLGFIRRAQHSRALAGYAPGRAAVWPHQPGPVAGYPGRPPPRSGGTALLVTGGVMLGLGLAGLAVVVML